MLAEWARNGAWPCDLNGTTASRAPTRLYALTDTTTAECCRCWCMSTSLVARLLPRTSSADTTTAKCCRCWCTSDKLVSRFLPPCYIGRRARHPHPCRPVLEPTDTGAWSRCWTPNCKCTRRSDKPLLQLATVVATHRCLPNSVASRLLSRQHSRCDYTSWSQTSIQTHSTHP